MRKTKGALKHLTVCEGDPLPPAITSHPPKVKIEAKPFALGVRVEHPQEFIDQIQYSCHSHDEVVSKRSYLPASSYSLVHQVQGHGVTISLLTCEAVLFNSAVDIIVF